MSGRKRATVTVDQSYITTLEKSEKELRRIRNDLPNLLRDLDRKRLRDLQNRLAPLQQRQNQFEQAISNLSSEVQYFEKRTTKRINHQKEQLQKELREQENRVNKEIRNLEKNTNKRLAQQKKEMHNLHKSTTKMIEEQGRILSRAIDEERKERQRQVNQLSDAIVKEAQARAKQGQQLTDAIHKQGVELSKAIEEEAKKRLEQGQQLSDAIRQVERSIKAKEDYRKEVATTWIESAEIIRDFIEKNYRHERFAPNRLKNLSRGIERARQSLSQNIPEPAITHAQNAYQNLSDLRLELESLEQEWEIWRNAALDSSREIFELAKENAMVPALNEKGEIVKNEEDKEIPVVVDEWTDGRLSELEKKVKDYIKDLENPDCSYDTDELENITENSLPELRRELEQIVRDARLGIISSQLRFGIADIVVDTLTEEGFDLEDETYESNDMRNGYVTKVRNPKGDEIVIRVVPKENNVGENDIEIHFYDVEQRSEQELKQRAKELQESLQQNGLQVGNIEEVDHNPEPLWRDIEKVRQGVQLHNKSMRN